MRLTNYQTRVNLWPVWSMDHSLACEPAVSGPAVLEDWTLPLRNITIVRTELNYRTTSWYLLKNYSVPGGNLHISGRGKTLSWAWLESVRITLHCHLGWIQRETPFQRVLTAEGRRILNVGSTTQSMVWIPGLNKKRGREKASYTSEFTFPFAFWLWLQCDLQSHATLLWWAVPQS